MAKSTDYPERIREFGMAISRFSQRHYDYDIFADFIDYVICCLLWEGDPDTVERLKNKYADDYPKFKELYVCFFKTMAKNLPGDDFDWYDVLGEIYETISSSSKASRLGQFFTPKPICDFMAAITAPIEGEQMHEQKLKVNDCASGSGRTLLAFNKIKPGNELYAEDFDPICSKMSTINLAIHGCKGQVCNMNSLCPDEWYFGFEINPRLYSTGGIPNIRRIQKEQSYTWSHWQHRRRELVEEQITTIIEQPKPKVEKAQNQLTLF